MGLEPRFQQCLIAEQRQTATTSPASKTSFAGTGGVVLETRNGFAGMLLVWIEAHAQRLNGQANSSGWSRESDTPGTRNRRRCHLDEGCDRLRQWAGSKL